MDLFRASFIKDLSALLAALRCAGCKAADKTEVSECGKFGRVMNPEGKRIEWWEPPGGGVGSQDE